MTSCRAAPLLALGVALAGAGASELPTLQLYGNNRLGGLNDAQLTALERQLPALLQRPEVTTRHPIALPDGAKVSATTGAPYQLNGDTCRALLLEVGDPREQTRHFPFELCRHAQHWSIDNRLDQLLRPGDHQLIHEQLLQLLNGAPGASAAWTSLDSGNQTHLQLASPHMHGGQPCQFVTIRVKGKQGSQAHGYYRMCRDENGDWTLSRD